MNYTIKGEVAQIANLTMNSGETCWSSRGAIVSLTQGIDWRLRVPGGVGGAIKRSFSGEGFSLTFIESNADNESVILSSNQPGKIIDWSLSEDGPVIATRGSFMAAFGDDIDITVTVARRAGAAFFGGAGMFLQQVSGDGIALVHGSGDFVDQYLAEGESIRVSTGNLAAFSHTVDYDIQSVAGCGRMLFGGEGLFMTKLTGPGRVLLQTLKRGSAGGAAAAATAAAG